MVDPKKLTKEEKQKRQFLTEILMYNLTKNGFEAPVFRVLPAHIQLLRGMLRFEDVSSGGWQYVRDIMKKGQFNSQINNVGNYLKRFLEGDLVESRMFQEEDNRGRMPKRGRKQYRIKPSLYAFELLQRIIVIWNFQQKRKQEPMRIQEKMIANNTTYLQVLKREVGLPDFDQFLESQEQLKYLRFKSQEQRITGEIKELQSELNRIQDGLKHLEVGRFKNK